MAPHHKHVPAKQRSLTRVCFPKLKHLGLTGYLLKTGQGALSALFFSGERKALVNERYEIPYPVSAYIIPQEAFIHQVRFDDVHIHIELTDGRINGWAYSFGTLEMDSGTLSCEREKYEISPDRTEIFWDPDKCDINDELRIADYLGSGRE